ncbi:MAG TPA: hypothetical protein VFL55_23275 [Acetobacteraceae bacterium]|nr:hypothetical protein [Acetobacteraceae bacterium]
MFVEVVVAPESGIGAPEPATVAPDPRPAPNHTMTEQDFADLRALMPRLAGDWICNAAKDEGGSTHAYITRRGCWSPSRRDYLVARRGGMLCLMLTRFPYGPQVLGGFMTMADLGAALGNAIGWRRS